MCTEKPEMNASAAAAAAELLGTYVFITCIFAASSSEVAAPLAIAAGLLAAIVAFGSVSGGHFNPAVSFAMFVKGSIDSRTFFTYVFMQLLGGFLALTTFKAMKQKA
jgi:aquaporin Z